MSIALRVVDWEAWAPGKESKHDWLDNQIAEPASPIPGAKKIPPMQRRRMSPLTKSALQPALELCEQQMPDYAIFASRHGEMPRTYQLLCAIDDLEPLSPTAFSQSVHNTAAGLFNILKKSQIPTNSIAAGVDTFPRAWQEAQAYLACHPDRSLMLVYFDEPLPVPYLEFCPEPKSPFSLALHLVAAPAGIRLSQQQESAGQESSGLHPRLFLEWLLKPSESLRIQKSSRLWVWSQDA
ncbi:beta-ketoacyl synthase chain length factor [Dongshaea marina]|uniref:beta-ketoacyl synthase chain length factor n=1 Tax=Dongshaea marina TaxID=2047966 RepID=UPI000D3E2E37|nr:beta-ketoacyl synthase chain length factor [Dongshaea marina]